MLRSTHELRTRINYVGNWPEKQYFVSRQIPFFEVLLEVLGVRLPTSVGLEDGFNDRAGLPGTRRDFAAEP